MEQIIEMVKDWQTLVAGVLALVAACFTIHATKKAACHQVDAALKQAGVAQDQLDEAKRMERRRILRESHAFLTMLTAAMDFVLEQAEQSRRDFGTRTEDTTPDRGVYEARNRIRKTAFSDLRGACLRLGSEFTENFLRLDAAIDRFAEKFEMSSRHMGELKLGVCSGFPTELREIELLAGSIRELSVQRLTRCSEQLHALEPGQI